jgi:predicted Zn-dependent protease
MPGGYIYITRGILAHLNSEAQLAGVLGHEVGHVTARHSAQRLTQQQLAQLGLGLASVLSESFARYGEAAQTALGLIFLKYGRDDENQADELGVDYATRAGYDPREIPSTYAMLKRVGERAGQRLPTFLSTHPDPGDREQRTTSLAAQAATGKTGLKVQGRAYVERLDGIVFGRDPRQGYAENERYYHPQLAFQLSFPAGWTIQDTRSAVIAVAPEQRASMQLTLEPAGERTPAGYVAELQRAGKIAGAEGGGETVGGFAAWVGRLRIQGRDGASATLAAGFIKRSADQLFQFLGQSAAPGDADEGRILASVRSLRALTDASRLAATPDHMRVIRASASGAFSEVVPKLGPQSASLEETSILNNLELDEDVRTGQLVKIVQAGRKR